MTAAEAQHIWVVRPPTCVLADSRAVIAGASEINVLHRRTQRWILSCLNSLSLERAEGLRYTDGGMQVTSIAASGIPMALLTLRDRAKPHKIHKVGIQMVQEMSYIRKMLPQLRGL